jgi:hypothetical protein
MNRKLTGIVFMIVFAVKMTISLVPLFSVLDKNTARAVIMQLEQESKGDKESPDKDALKEKKSFDELLLVIFNYDLFRIAINCLHTQEQALIVQPYHPVVPTPPPNA